MTSLAPHNRNFVGAVVVVVVVVGVVVIFVVIYWIAILKECPSPVTNFPSCDKICHMKIVKVRYVDSG